MTKSQPILLRNPNDQREFHKPKHTCYVKCQFSSKILLLWDNVESYCRADRLQMAIAHAHCILETWGYIIHSEYAILTAFPLHLGCKIAPHCNVMRTSAVMLIMGCLGVRWFNWSNSRLIQVAVIYSGYFGWFMFDILQLAVCAVAVEALRHQLAPRLMSAWCKVFIRNYFTGTSQAWHWACWYSWAYSMKRTAAACGLLGSQVRFPLSECIVFSCVCCVFFT
jgi:hypothetical protein